MEETNPLIVIIGAADAINLVKMSPAVARLVQDMDIRCVSTLKAKAIEMACPEIDSTLEAKAIEMACPEIDLPPIDANCFGLWECDDVLDAKAMAAALMPIVHPMPPVSLGEQERLVGTARPYRGYVNSRQGRRRKW